MRLRVEVQTVIGWSSPWAELVNPNRKKSVVGNMDEGEEGHKRGDTYVERFDHQLWKL